MSYVALYRKFRPTTFEEVKGQDHIVTTLKNQIKAGRMQHAYLFCGTRGTGKTSVAKILAKAVNCEHPSDGSPCNECEMCRSIQNGTSMNVIEIDAASNNGVDNIREIIDEVQYRPTQGKYKVYIIDEVHMLSTGAFNALLKTLEEPPEYVIFILATTEAAKIPLTILSRCQRYDFHRIGIDVLTDRMKELTAAEGAEAEDKALRYIARSADGSMRDALSLLDQCMAFYMGQKLTYEKVLDVLGAVDTEVFGELLKEIIRGNAAASIRLYENLIANGREIGQFVSDFTWYLRDLLLVKTSKDGDVDAVDASAEKMQELREISSVAEAETLMRYIRILSDLSNQIRYASNRRVLVEIALIRMTRPQMEKTEDAVSDRIRRLEMKVEELSRRPAVYAAPEDEKPEKAVASSGKTAEAKPDPEVVPLAAPEDLRKIKADWLSITGRLKDRLHRQILGEAVPQYDSSTAENKLYVEVPDTLGELCVTDEVRDTLMKIIEQTYGRHVDLELHLAKDHKSNLAPIGDVSTGISRINMPVEETEEDEEDG